MSNTLAHVEAWFPDLELDTLNIHFPFTDTLCQKFSFHSVSFHFEPDVGIPGQVWATNKVIVTPDVQKLKQMNFLRKYLAIECGLNGACAVPIPVSSYTQIRKVNKTKCSGVLVAFFSNPINCNDKAILAITTELANKLSDDLKDMKYNLLTRPSFTLYDKNDIFMHNVLQTIDDLVFHLVFQDNCIIVDNCSASVYNIFPNVVGNNIANVICFDNEAIIEEFKSTNKSITFEAHLVSSVSTMYEHKITWCDKKSGVASMVSRNITIRNETNQRNLKYNLIAKEKECNSKAMGFITHQIKNKFLALSEAIEQLCWTENNKNVSQSKAELVNLIDEGLSICMNEQMAVELYNDEYVEKPVTINLMEFLKNHFSSCSLLNKFNTTMIVDKNVLLHTLNNFVSNAKKYGDGTNPSINVTKVKRENNAYQWCIAITNNKGVNHESIHKKYGDANVFSVLMQSSHNSNGTLPVGTSNHSIKSIKLSQGNGLYICSKCAQYMNAQLSIRFHETYVGSYIYIPIKTKSQPEIYSSGQNNLVYVVDDDKMIRKMFERKLNSIGKTVQLFGTPEDIENIVDTISTLEILKRPSIILMDQHLSSNVFGTDLIRQLRDKNYMGCIAMISANDSNTDISLYINAGADGFIPKTSKGPELKELIEIILLKRDNK